MNIMFLSHYFPPEVNAPATRTFEHCRRWVSAGHHVTVVTCAPNCPEGRVYEGYKNKLIQEEIVDGIRVVRLWTYIAANKGTVRRIINYLSFMVSALFYGMRAPKPDILLATSPQFFCGLAGAVLGRIRCIPFLLEIRDIWPESITAVGAMRNKRLLRFLERLEKKLYKLADRIVTVGDGYRDQLIRKGVSEDKLFVIVNGIDPKVFVPVEPDQSLKDKLKLNHKYVCSYIGTIGMASGLEIVLEAAAKLNNSGQTDIAFLLVGDGADREKLQKKAEDCHLRNVIFTGRQPKDRIPALFAISDVCLVHLIKQELFKTVLPSKLFEAAGMGKPILLGVEGEAVKMLQKWQAGITFEPENVEEFIKALLELYEDRHLGRQMGESGRKYVIAHYNRDTLAQDYLTLLRFVKSTCREKQNTR
ncbi:glycosyltransferase family 4 protein [bacterium]|nr:glycosyltransferase family 4 protein [candidate division CSSED10-310 bacterium]